jgi:hypothetical protein
MRYDVLPIAGDISPTDLQAIERSQDAKGKSSDTTRYSREAIHQPSQQGILHIFRFLSLIRPRLFATGGSIHGRPVALFREDHDKS